MVTDHTRSALKYYPLLILLCILAFFSVLNEMVLNVSFPEIAADFNKLPSSVNWVNTAFMLTFSVGTAIYGKLSDQLGMRRLLLFGIVMNCCGSIVGFMGHSYFPVLIIGRLLQGIGAAAFPALVMVVVARYIPVESRGRAFGLIGSIVAMGEGIGPVVGGMIAHYVHWSYLLLLPAVTMLTIPFLVRILQKEQRISGTFDLLGIVWMTIGIVSFMLFITFYQVVLLLVSIISFVIFIRHIRKVADPFVDPALGNNKTFLIGVVAGGLIFGTVAAFIAMIPYMMKELHQLSTAAIGSGIIFPGTILVIFFGYIGGVLVDKQGVRFVFTVSMVLMTGSFLAAAMFVEVSPWFMTFVFIIVFAALSFAKTVVSTIVSNSLQQQEAGAGMSLLNFTSFLSEGIGIAIVGGLLSISLLDRKLIPIEVDISSHLYRNILLLFAIIIVISWLMTLRMYKRSVVTES